MKIGPYTVGALLHAGAETQVHRGERDHDRLPVALKIPRVDRPGVHARLRHEYALLRDLERPGIVRAIDLVTDGDRLALVLEDLAGPTLKDLIAQGPLDVARALEIGAGLADALAELHGRGILHRDIKPGNVAFHPRSGAVTLIDFGLAAAERDAQTRDAPLGTLAYVSPELTGRTGRAVDHRADLYSLGVTLFRILTGALPFDADDPVTLVYSHLAVTPKLAQALRPSVPPIVGAIIARLLAKPAEARYQSASALAHDLREALARLDGRGGIAAFELGRRDRVAELRTARRLHGRAVDLDLLAGALARARDGDGGVALLVGGAGAGKSALLGGLARLALREGAQVGAARFTAGGGAAPFAAIGRALGDLVLGVLGASEGVIAARRGELVAAVGERLRVLAPIVPDLVRLIGPQRAAAEVNPADAQHRLALAVADFVDVFASAQPVVLLLDDADAADPASLRLLGWLLDGSPRRLLVVMTRRPGPAPALDEALVELRAGPLHVVERALADLEVDDLVALLVEIAGGVADDHRPLAELLRIKTGGNPLAVEGFLRGVRDAGHLRFDPDAGRWVADLEAIAAAPVTANVAELTAARLARQPPRVRDVLEVAACVGRPFDPALVVELRGDPGARDDLDVALREGILQHDVGGRLDFAHTQVRAAALAGADDEARARAHLHLGRRRLVEAELDDDGLFEAVAHLNRAAALIDDPGERRRIAGLDLRAGLRARRATDFATARSLLAAASTLLPAGDDGGELWFEVHVALAECEALVNDVDAAERRFAALLRGTVGRAALARIYTRLTVLRSLRGAYREALEAGSAGLSLFGVTLPDGPEALPEALARERVALAAALGDCDIDTLGDGPALADADVGAALELLVTLGAATYFLSRGLYTLAVLTRVRLDLAHGQSGLSPYAYATYGLVLIDDGDHERARAFFERARALVARGSRPEYAAKVHGVIGLTSHFSRPLRDKIADFERSIAAGVDAGDLLYVCYGRYNLALTRLSLGEEVSALADQIDGEIALVRRADNGIAAAMLVISRQLARALAGRTADPRALSDEGFDEDAFAAALQPAAACWFHTARIIARLLDEDPIGAVAAIDPAHAASPLVGGQHHSTELRFFACLALLAVDPSTRAAHAERLAEYREELARWAARAPMNYLHMHLLVDAEVARVAGDHGRARECYDQAIDAAEAGGFRHHAAIASELAARYYLGRRRPRVARLYLEDALHGYRRWGAVAAARRLLDTHRELLSSHAGDGEGGADGDSTKSDRSDRSGRSGPSLDLLSVLKASHVFANELELEPLLATVMRIVVENAGAERGLLLLEDEGALRRAASHPEAAPTADDGVAAPMSIVYRAHQGGEPIVLADAATDLRFTGDPYLVTHAPRSILCVPIVHQTKRLGVLYLENNLSTGAFTRERADVLTLLGAQIAISIEHSRLFSHLEAARRAAEAASRTKSAFLANMSHELRTPLNVVIGYSELLLELPADARASDAFTDLRKIRGAGGHLLAILTDILDIAKIESNTLELADEPFEVRALVEEVVAALAQQIAAGGNTLTLTCADAVGARRGDPTKVRQLLYNIVSNAAKFTRDGHIAVRVEPAGEGERVRFVVADDGIGIPPAKQAAIFEAFVQVDESSTRRHGGTGLGLAISHRLCAQMGGTITVESEVGRGATFTITVPLRPSTTSADAADLGPPPS